jgi:hypothetical protein
MDEEGGVLGKLPRSRPGTRSQKRASGKAEEAPRSAGSGRPGDTAGRAAVNAERRGRKAARPASARTSTGRDSPAGALAPEDTSGGDPVGDAVRLALKLPVYSARVGAGVTRELLRRLPRP